MSEGIIISLIGAVAVIVAAVIPTAATVAAIKKSSETKPRRKAAKTPSRETPAVPLMTAETSKHARAHFIVRVLLPVFDLLVFVLWGWVSVRTLLLPEPSTKDVVMLLVAGVSVLLRNGWR